MGLPAPAATAAPTRPDLTRSAGEAARPASPEAEFLIVVHQGNLAQMAAGRLAEQKSENRTVRRLGKRFAAYHRQLDAQVRQAAAALSVRLPDQPNSEQLMLAARYRAATVTDFDALFIDTQLSWYERAAKLARQVLRVTDEPSIVAIIAAAGPVIEEHRLALTTTRDQLVKYRQRQ